MSERPEEEEGIAARKFGAVVPQITLNAKIDADGVLHAEVFGADPTGVADSTDAFQDAIANQQENTDEY